MATSIQIKNRLIRINEKFANHLTPRESWTPIDEAVYKPIDPLQVLTDEAETMQLKAIKYAFTLQYASSHFYSRLCDKGASRPKTSRPTKT